MGEEPTMGTMGGPGYGRFPLGSAGPEFVYDDAGNPIMEPEFNTTFPPMGGMPESPPIQIPGGAGGFEIPGIDLERIRESLAKIEPIIPGISLPQPQPVPVRPRMPMPSPTFEPEINPFDNPLFSDPGLGGEGGGRNVPMPMPMPAPMPKIRPMPAPLPRVISDPVRPKPAPITRGIGGVRRMPAGRRR
jgi:hypothetical protein